MRCSSSRPLLDDFVDGTLSPLVRARVLRHVDGCVPCQGVLEELRVVDALLLAPRQLEPAPNFTFRAMADVRTLPAPRVHRTPTLGVVLSYLVFAWLAIGAWFVIAGQSAPATLGFLATFVRQYSAGLDALTQTTSRLFGHSAPGIGVAAGAILALDALLAVVVVLAYAFIRPRVLARAARLSEGSP